jgi:hypothetical protein
MVFGGGHGGCGHGASARISTGSIRHSVPDALVARIRSSGGLQCFRVCVAGCIDAGFGDGVGDLVCRLFFGGRMFQYFF